MRLLSGIAALTLVGCASQAQAPQTPLAPPAEASASPQAEEKRPGDHLEVGGKTTLASFALGGRMVGHSFWAMGAAVGGLFEDGFDGAGSRWDARVEVMRDVARMEADKVAQASHGDDEPEASEAKTIAKR